MWARRSLELGTEGQGLPQPYIGRETLAECRLAQSVLAQAEAQAQALLEQAADDARAVVLQAEAQFWQAAEHCLGAWEAERQAMWDSLEASATRLTNEALRSALGEVSAEARIQALVQQLARNERAAISATLECHPDQFEVLARLLAATARPWRAQANSELEPGRLRLATENGSFGLDWAIAVEALSLPTCAG